MAAYPKSFPFPLHVGMHLHLLLNYIGDRQIFRSSKVSAGKMFKKLKMFGKTNGHT